ncbi:MAG: hypothetical protein IT373_06640 [Polyangiaceae bacterium]|nr:hypothetical protein [Polyangiaceae bacterium]
MTRALIGLDDTDHGDSIGTGALARELGLYLERLAGAVSLGITRHQLLVDPRIPYTSHNSAACLAVDSPAPLGQLEELTRGFVTTLLHLGADPGLCLLEPGAGDYRELGDFGRRAQTTVLAHEEARELCRRAGLRHHELGGSGLGVLGAAAACGLRLGGDDGRFISLPGTRELDGVLSVGEILRLSPIERVVDEEARVLDAGERVDTCGWVRPDLVAGAIVLRTRRTGPGEPYLVERDKHRDKH